MIPMNSSQENDNAPGWRTRRARPRGADLLGRGLAFALLALVPVVLLLELLHSSGGVDELHLPGEERMAGRADFDGDVLPRAAGGELVATATGDRGLLVLGMNAFLHDSLQGRG